MNGLSTVVIDNGGEIPQKSISVSNSKKWGGMSLASTKYVKAKLPKSPKDPYKVTRVTKDTSLEDIGLSIEALNKYYHNSSMVNVKEGDNVRCIDNTSSSFLELNEKYTVHSVYERCGKLYIALKEATVINTSRFPHSEGRTLYKITNFKLATEANRITLDI